MAQRRTERIVERIAAERGASEPGPVARGASEPGPVARGASEPRPSGRGASERPATERVLSDAEFSAAVAAVTSAFGDPTRRDIYLFARSEKGATAAEVAERFELHPNVARHHLDKLAAGGYLEVVLERPGGGGAGRPSKRYRAVPGGTGLELHAKSEDLMVRLLGNALGLLPPDVAESMAERVGEEYGRALAAQMAPGEGQRSLRSALHAVADALTAHGFAAHTESRSGALTIISDLCPFGDTAVQHPVICAVDRGMVRGMLAGLYGDTAPTTEANRAQGATACVTVV